MSDQNMTPSTEKGAERLRILQCDLHPLSTLTDYKYVAICSRFGDKWLLSRHKKRETWETQGGHIEAGEAPMETARRELYEESGVTNAELFPLCDYHGYDPYGYANGVVFLAVIHEMGHLPDSEMAEVALFDELPPNLTYPNVSPVFFREAEQMLERLATDKNFSL